MAPLNGQQLEMEGAKTIYLALKELVSRHRLQGFTLRCFDLLTTVHNTGCLALARLNAEGIVSGCEGDVPTLLTMAIVKVLTGVSGLMEAGLAWKPLTPSSDWAIFIESMAGTSPSQPATIPSAFSFANAIHPVSRMVVSRSKHRRVKPCNWYFSTKAFRAS